MVHRPYVHIRFGHFSCLGISFSRSSEFFLAIPSQGHAGGSSVHYRPCPELGGPSWRMWLTVKVAKTGSKPRGRVPRRQSLANLSETQQLQFKKIASCLFISTSVHHSFADSTSISVTRRVITVQEYLRLRFYTSQRANQVKRCCCRQVLEHASAVLNIFYLWCCFGFKFGSHRKSAIISQRHHRGLIFRWQNIFRSSWLQSM